MPHTLADLALALAYRIVAVERHWHVRRLIRLSATRERLEARRRSLARR